MGIPVFCSVGRTATPQQQLFVASVERLLVEHGFEPQRAEFSSVSPLKKIKELMDRSSGTAIIALERLHAPSATELRNGPSARALGELSLTTIWSQIEATMAYSRDHPLLVICESTLRAEGLLESRYDWWVHQVDLASPNIDSREFRGIFDDWSQRVKERHEARNRPPPPVAAETREPTIGQILGRLTPPQLWTAGATIVSALSAYSGLVFWLGSKFGGH